MLILSASNTQGDSIDLFFLTLISIEKKPKFAPQEFVRILLFSSSCTIPMQLLMKNSNIIRLPIGLILIFLQGKIFDTNFVANSGSNQN